MDGSGNYRRLQSEHLSPPGAGVSHCHCVLGPREMKQQTPALGYTPGTPGASDCPAREPSTSGLEQLRPGPAEEAGGRHQWGLLINEESDPRTGMNYPGSGCPFGQNELSLQITSLTFPPPSLRGLPSSLTPYMA